MQAESLKSYGNSRTGKYLSSLSTDAVYLFLLTIIFNVEEVVPFFSLINFSDNY